MSKYMPDSNGRRKHEKLDKDQLREATFEFFDHVKSHNDVPFHAAIVLAISDDMDDRKKQHMCQFVGGEPSALASAHTYQSALGFSRPDRLSSNQAC